MQNVVGEAVEFICLTRPDNTLNQEGKVYIPLNCTDAEFENEINENFNIQKTNSIDNIAKQDAMENPFN